MTSLFGVIAAVVVFEAMGPAVASAQPGAPSTSFQTGGMWAPAMDIRTSAAIVYSCEKERMDSWARHGYAVQTMGGFRTGTEYAKKHPEEVQTTRDGTLLTCGPGSYYMVPTQRRIQAMVDFFLTAIRNGSTAVIPEEPEYFASAGYSQSFKEAWQAEYDEPWQDPESSFDARIKSERLKGAMQYSLILSILRAAQKENPKVKRMVAHHSPVNYHWWGISFPFHDFAAMPELQEVIGQVWTGTARSAAMYEGQMKERTFETALLEYSSLVELYRGTGKRLWFLADPLEDNLDRSMEDYRENYTHTLVASLMFPEVNAYEVLPWPDRIYGRVPPEYATVLGCVFRALKEVSQIPANPRPSSRIGVFIGDSAAYQRAAPSSNDLSGFHGLTFPFVYAGIPIRIAPIEQVAEKDYLKTFKLLILSYDFFKPMKPEYNTAITQWVKKGGHLILVGGSNDYNKADQWWRKLGYSSPDEHLLKGMGLNMKRVSSNILTEYQSDNPNIKFTRRDVAAVLKGFTAKVGKGSVRHFGVPAAEFAKASGALLVDAAKDLCEASGFKIKAERLYVRNRGSYTAVHAQEGQCKLPGEWIDLFDASLPIVKDPSIEQGASRLFRKFNKSSQPEVLAASYQADVVESDDKEMRVRNIGPEKTPGALRIWMGGRGVAGLTCTGSDGKQVDCKHLEQAGTLFITFPGSPDGVTTTVKWAKK